MCVLRVQLYGQLPLTLIIDTDLTVTARISAKYVELEVMSAVLSRPARHGTIILQVKCPSVSPGLAVGGEERAVTFTDRITVWSSLIKSSDRKYGNNKISVRAQHHCTSLHCTGH